MTPVAQMKHTSRGSFQTFGIKMKQSNDIELDNLIDVIFSELLRESDRGSVIMGADILDSQLNLKLDEIMTSNAIKPKERKRMLQFNGVFGTLSSKIDALYAFGCISDKSRNSANALRKIRNNAAHSNERFEMSDNSDHLMNMYDLGADNVPELINVLAQDHLIKRFTLNALSSDAGRAPLFNSEDEAKKYLRSSPEALGRIGKHIPQVSFAFGLIFLCREILQYKWKPNKSSEPT